MQSNAVGSSAWILLGVLAIVVIAALWEHWGRAELEIGLLLAVSVPVLIANRFAGDLSAASATRWALAICFVVCSAAVWGRKWLKILCEKLHVQLEMAPRRSTYGPGRVGNPVGLAGSITDACSSHDSTCRL